MTAERIGELFILALAIFAAIRCWKEGSIFQGWRATVEAYAALFWEGKKRHFWAAILDCPFCLSFHAAIWPELLVRLPESIHFVLTRTRKGHVLILVASLVRFLLYCLAATAMSWIFGAGYDALITSNSRSNDGEDVPRESVPDPAGSSDHGGSAGS